MLLTDTDNSINTMDELERRDLKGRFLSSKQKNPLQFWIMIIPMLQVNVREYISLFEHSYFNGLITDTRNFINLTLKLLTAGFIYRILAIN